MDETKWFILMVGVWVICMAGGAMYATHTTNECRVAAIQAGKNSTEIAAICK